MTVTVKRPQYIAKAGTARHSTHEIELEAPSESHDRTWRFLHRLNYQHGKERMIVGVTAMNSMGGGYHASIQLDDYRLKFIDAHVVEVTFPPYIAAGPYEIGVIVVPL